mmetsp:Transcript_3416/g.4195  ORF Transcript_3416/g.4195 Transcript_3416/m.4195 type:complete len:144 (-) Transcript_3416:119-550(-)|eukprot:CAMPEP_0203635814 /NCGR_PEP_ID=MMETSP0088-20131115/2520_1 /ASSEMBLY_ACC=CAM_ASM_001087 /TAXON_ID=426623 /ORGANISM="Chaetoceros affinis, Strain CCMP159" /LENGTH=143 /DNA_ID=CAMNT_0050489809 /DNA_START=114 /DNA_END=545 /DNA_ORIENTATION=+
MDPLNSSSIPVMRSPPNLMYNGPNSDNLAAAAVQAHPIDRMQRAHANNANSSLDIDAVRRLYGSALAMRLVTERKLASNVGGRLPGMDSHPDSNVMFDALTGNDLQLDFGDFLNVRADRADVGRNVAHDKDLVHSTMEARLGL